MKELKERFSRWFNKKHARRGTLWMDRFCSVIVEAGECLRTVAAYIDLNPIRAGDGGEAGGIPLVWVYGGAGW